MADMSIIISLKISLSQFLLSEINLISIQLMNACTIQYFFSADAAIVTFIYRHIHDITVVIVRIPHFLRGGGEFEQ